MKPVYLIFLRNKSIFSVAGYVLCLLHKHIEQDKGITHAQHAQQFAYQYRKSA